MQKGQDSSNQESTNPISYAPIHEIPSTHQELNLENSISNAQTPQTNSISQSVPVHPVFVPTQGPNGVYYLPVSNPHQSDRSTPFQRPNKPVAGVYQGIPISMPPGSGITQQFSGPIKVRRPGIIKELRKIYNEMNLQQKLKVHLVIYGCYNAFLVWTMFWNLISFTSINKLHMSLVGFMFFLGSLIFSCPISAITSSGRINAYESMLQLMEGLRIIGIYNILLFIAFDGFHLMGIKEFILVVLYVPVISWIIKGTIKLKEASNSGSSSSTTSKRPRKQ